MICHIEKSELILTCPFELHPEYRYSIQHIFTKILLFLIYVKYLHFLTFDNKHLYSRIVSKTSKLFQVYLNSLKL